MQISRKSTKKKAHTQLFFKKIWSIQKKAVLLHAFSSDRIVMPFPAEAGFPD